jgi:hypothetical protein
MPVQKAGFSVQHPCLNQYQDYLQAVVDDVVFRWSQPL